MATKRSDDKKAIPPIKAEVGFEDFVRAAMATGKPPKTKGRKIAKAKPSKPRKRG